jgi:WD40 repeat protein
MCALQAVGAQRLRDCDNRIACGVAGENTDEPAFVRSVCFTPCDSMVLAASEDSAVRLWAVGGDRGLIHTFRGHTADVNAVDSGKAAAGSFVTGSSDGKAIVWDLESGKWIAQLEPPTSAKRHLAAGLAEPAEVMSVASSKDGRQVAVGGLDKTLRLFDVRAVRSLFQEACPFTKPVRLCGGYVCTFVCIKWRGEWRELCSNVLSKSNG